MSEPVERQRVTAAHARSRWRFNTSIRYLKPDLLIIDHMAMNQLPKRSGEYLFEIVMRRYETRSMMMTSNRPLEDWGKLIDDVPDGLTAERVNVDVNGHGKQRVTEQ